MTPSDRFTAAACRSAAALWRNDGSEAHRAFADTLDQWATNADRRAVEAESGQRDLFAPSVNPTPNEGSEP